MKSLPILLHDYTRKGIIFSLTEEGVAYKDSRNNLTQADKDYLRSIREELKSHLLAERVAKEPYCSDGDAELVPSLTQECWWNWVKNDPNQRQNNRIRIIKAY